MKAPYATEIENQRINANLYWLYKRNQSEMEKYFEPPQQLSNVLPHLTLKDNCNLNGDEILAFLKKPDAPQKHCKVSKNLCTLIENITFEGNEAKLHIKKEGMPDNIFNRINRLLYVLCDFLQTHFVFRAFELPHQSARQPYLILRSNSDLRDKTKLLAKLKEIISAPSEKNRSSMTTKGRSTPQIMTGFEKRQLELPPLSSVLKDEIKLPLDAAHQFVEISPRNFKSSLLVNIISAHAKRIEPEDELIHIKRRLA